MALNLQKHQEDAYKNVNKHFEEGDRSIVIFPTGCGKSFVALKLMEDNRDKNILFIAPSKPIRKQMYEYIVEYLSTEENDSEIVQEEQIKGRELSLKEKVKIILPNFEALLYQTIISKREKTQKLVKQLKPDFTICDESQHIKIGENQEQYNIWGAGIEKMANENPKMKILGLTATPERCDGVNVAIEFFNEQIASEISLVEALASDDISVKAPDYVTCEYTLINEIDEDSVQEQIKKYETTDPQKANSLQEKLNVMRKVADSGKGISDLFTEHLTTPEAKELGRDKGKYLVFCSCIEDMKQKMREAKTWFVGVDSNPEIYAISSEYNYSANIPDGKKEKSQKVITDFENSQSEHIKLLFSVDMLNEGVHIDDVSGVIMTRKTNSRLVYLQQLGRAISSDPKKARTIVFDFANNYLTYNIYGELIEARKNSCKSDIDFGDEIEEDDNYYIKDAKWISAFKIAGVMKDLVELLQKGKLNTVQEFIDILEVLQQNRVDVSKMTTTDTIKTLAEKSNVNLEVLREAGLDLTFKIGSRKTNITSAYRGKIKGIKPTEEQVQILKDKFGISISLEKQDIVQEFIDILEILEINGVDVSKMTTRDTVKTLAEKSNVNLEVLRKVLNEHDIDLALQIGKKKDNITQAYRGKGSYTPPTEEQVQILKDKFGISISLEKQDVAQEFIDILEILELNGVDVSKIVKRDTIETLAKKSNISLEVLKKAGLDLTLKIGSRKNNIVSAYRGKGGYIPPTEEQVQILKDKFRISLEAKKKIKIQDLGKVTYVSNIEQCDKALSITQSAVLEQEEQQSTQGIDKQE